LHRNNTKIPNKLENLMTILIVHYKYQIYAKDTNFMQKHKSSMLKDSSNLCKSCAITCHIVG
jgi:hypothetical protein